MSSTTSTRREHEFSKYLKVAVESRSVGRIYASRGEQSIGEISVKIYYNCDKLLHTCFEDGEVTYEISSSGGLKLTSEIAELTYDVNGKLKGEVKGADTIALQVSRGRGEGSLSYKYALKAEDVKIGKYLITITLFYVSKKGEKKRLIEPIPLEFEVVKPLRVDELAITPVRDYYVVGDPVKLTLKIASEYEGVVEIECRGAVKDMHFRREIKKGVAEIPIDAVIIKPGDKVEVTIKTTGILYEESVAKTLTIKEQRVLLKGVSVGTAEIGKEATVIATVVNLSSISETEVHIKATLYGFQLEASRALKPEEAGEVVLKTPVLTGKSAENLKGEIEVRVPQLELAVSKQIELPKPKALPVKVEMATPELKIPSSTLGELQLRVKNDSDLNVDIILSNVSSNLCEVVQERKIEVTANSSEAFPIRFKPLSLGSEKVVLRFAALVNGVVVEEYSVTLNVEVYRSFKVESYEVLYPTEASHVVKGQRLELQVKVNVFYDIVSLTVKSPDLEIESPQQTAYKPWINLLITGKALNYTDSIRIIVSDGLIEEELKLPIKISKPFLDYEVKATKLFAGVRRPVGIAFKNVFDVPLKAAIHVEVSGPAEISNKEFEIRVAPHEEEKVEVGITGLWESSVELHLKVRSDDIGEESGKVEDSSIQEHSVKLEVYRPIQVRIDRPAATLQLPYPAKGKIRNVRTPFKIKAFLRNVSDVALPGITVEPRVSAGEVGFSVNPKTLLLGHGMEESVSIELRVPASYSSDTLSVDLDVMIGRYKVASSKVQVSVRRVVHVPMYVPRQRFVEEECRYPYVAVESGVYILVPVTEENVSLCGEPQEPYVKRHKVLRDIYTYVERRLSANITHGDPWLIAASIVFKGVAEARPDYSSELKSLEEVRYLDGDMVLIPALLWRVVIAGLARKETGAGSVKEFLTKGEGLGLVYIRGAPLYKARNPLYEGLVKLLTAEDEDALRDLQSYIQRSIAEGRIDPLFLLYRLHELYSHNRELRLSFNRNVAEGLYNERRFKEYLLYLALTNIPLTEGGLLEKVDEIVKGGSAEGKSALLALSIILRGLIEENMNELVEVLS